ncbi:hypothetical protein ACJIZ3_019939 [Penstemon smallii]|uniref:TF-B3 domain-containing protein n=1 Tax=Penstemon smallii TaxID=265156 RepID=A0ABD3T2I7_9LAMI
MASDNLALGLRFFVQISKYFKRNPMFEIPPDFKDIALSELGHNKKGSVRVQNNVYECVIVHSGGNVFIDGKGIANIASDFNISKRDVVFFEYHGNAIFYCIVCCGCTYMEKKSLGSGTPVRFFVEAISYDGMEFPDLLFSFFPYKETNPFFNVETRLGTWKIEVKHGHAWTMLGGACWQSFHNAHDLHRSMYIQMDYHGNGNFTATVFNQNSCCEQPFSLNGMLFGKVEESFQELKCLCNIDTVDTNGNGENVDDADNIDNEYQLNGNCPQFENVIDSWIITAKRHMVPQYCTKTLPRMYIPAAKWKKHQMDGSKAVIFFVESCTETRWEVFVHLYKNNGKTVRVGLTQGWTKFANDNNLRIGAKIKINLLSPPEQDHSDGKTLYMSISFK